MRKKVIVRIKSSPWFDYSFQDYLVGRVFEGYVNDTGCYTIFTGAVAKKQPLTNTWCFDSEELEVLWKES